MAIEGSLDLFRLPEILQVISQENKTGILTVQGERDIIAISFSKGRVVAADALNQTLEEALGETLDREDLLARNEYEAALVDQRTHGGRLIDVLVDRGYLDRSELLAGLRQHTSDLLSDVLVWEEGDFKFYTNDEVSYEEGFDPISVESLLLSNLDVAEPAPVPEEPSPAEISSAPETPVAVPSPATPEPVEPEARPAPTFDEPESLPLADPFPAPERKAPSPSTPRREPSQAAPRPPVASPRATRVRPAARTATIPEASSPAWIPWVLAVGVAVGVAAAVWLLPSSRLLLPLPWNDSPRAVLETARHNAWIDHVGDAVRTFHLLEGRLPESTEMLLERGLLTGDVLDVGAWEYNPGPEVFRLSLGHTTAEPSLKGDFLLDPEFLLGAGRLREKPLVLLD